MSKLLLRGTCHVHPIYRPFAELAPPGRRSVPYGRCTRHSGDAHGWWQCAGAKLGEPDKPSTPADTINKDWTERKKQEAAKQAEEPPKEPIYKMLLEFIQSMWRASGSAVELAQQMNEAAMKDRLNQVGQKLPPDAEQPLTYSDLKVKRTTSTLP